MKTPQIIRKTGFSRNDSGTAIVAVLVAMTFVGIVVAALVRNTGTQSRFTSSFGTVMGANLAVSNGIIATESFFDEARRDSVHIDNALNLLTTNLTHDIWQPVIGTRSGENITRRSVGEQFISSKLVRVRTTDEKVFADFEIDGNPRVGGKALRSAKAFYEVGNVVIQQQPGGKLGSNAYYMGRGRMYANTPVIVKGNATFSQTPVNIYEPFEFNSNATPIKFEKDEQGRGDVYFDVPVSFQVSGTSEVHFETNAYFAHPVRFNEVPSDLHIFKADVAFNSNFSVATSAAKVQTSGNVWINGGYKDFSGNNRKAVLENIAPSDNTRTLHHTTNMAFYIEGVCDPSSLSVGVICTLHGGDIYHGSADQRITPEANAPGFDVNFHSTTMNEAYMLSQLNMTPLADRREPNLALNVGPGTENADKEFMLLGDIPNSGDGAALTAYIQNARNDESMARYFYPNQATGHFLIDWTNHGVVWGNPNTTTFNEKAVFRVDGSVGPSGNFYLSGADASSMIYVGPNGILDNFGSNGDFNGLIYVHHDNENTHTFNWKQEGTISGAVLMNGGAQVSWNTSSAITTIRRDDEILSVFCAMLKNLSYPGQPACIGGDGAPPEIVRDTTTSTSGGSNAMDLRTLGIYFH